jgi:hypothetical protein
MHHRSVLFVSASEDFTHLYGVGLRSDGWLPVFVPSVDAALSLLTQFSVCAAVFHLEPDSDEQWQACEALIGRGVPVLVLTAWLRPDGRNRARAAAAACIAFVAEPCTPFDLSHVLRRTLSGESGIVWPDRLKQG